MNAALKKPVLLIEDEASVLAFVRAALERDGYTVVGVRSGVLGLEMLASQEFRGIISDIRTPGGVSGVDVYRWISEFRPELVKHLMFITGDMVNLQTVHALHSTGVPFIEKPFRVHEFLEMVRGVIGTADE